MTCSCEDPRCTDELVPADYWAILTIFGEARSEGAEGMLAVASVIRNRMKRRFFSDGTVQGTVLRDRQFSLWNHTDPQRIRVCKAKMEDPLLLAAKLAWDRSASTSNVGDAVLYHADYVSPSWKDHDRIERVATIGRHIFYDDKEA